MVEQAEQIAHRLADRDAARFVFLEGARAATENFARRALRQPEPLADASDLPRREHSVGAGLQIHEGCLCRPHVRRVQQHFVARFAVQSRLRHVGLEMFVGNGVRARIPDHRSAASGAGTPIDLFLAVFAGHRRLLSFRQGHFSLKDNRTNPPITVNLT